MTLYRSFEVRTARVENLDGSSSQPIDVKSLNVAFDSTWSPYCQATLICAQPAGAVVTAIEPRADANPRVRFTLRQTDGGTVVDRSFDLGLRSRSISWATREMTLTAASDEALTADYARGTAVTYAADSVLLASNLANQALPPSVPGLTLEAGHPDADVVGPDAAIDPGTTVWDYCSSMAEAAGARIYCDETRVFHWASPTWTPDTTVRTITDAGSGGTVLDVVDVVSRDDPTWANFAVVAYTGNSPVQYVYDSGAATNRKAIVVQRSRRKPAGNAAVKIRTAAEKRGRNLTVRAAAEVLARPQQTWRATYGDQSWQGIVQSVSFDFPDGVMSLTVNINSA